MSETSDLSEQLRELEARLQDPSVRRDARALEPLLAAEFVEFGSSGTVYTRAEIVAALADEVPMRIRMEAFRVQRVAAAVALVTYRSVAERGALGTTRTLRSSLWRRDEAGWQMVFHQGTRTPEGTA